MAETVEVELSEATTEEDMRQWSDLRYEVLRKPHGEPRGSENDHPLEAISTHLVAKIDGRVVGGCCFAILSRPDGKGGRMKYSRFRQVAVHPDYRMFGIATKLTDMLEARSKEMGALEVTGTTRDELVEYYRRKGYHTTGEGPTLFGDVKHTHICKPLV